MWNTLLWSRLAKVSRIRDGQAPGRFRVVRVTEYALAVILLLKVPISWALNEDYRFNLPDFIRHIITALLIFSAVPAREVRTDWRVVVSLLISFTSSFFFEFPERLVAVVPVVSAAAFYSLFGIAGYLALGSSFGVFPAKRGIVTRGPYQLVRHPIYASFFFVGLLILIVHPVPRNFVTFLFYFFGLYSRITFEERIFESDPSYSAYSSKVSARLMRPVLFVPLLIVLVYELKASHLKRVRFSQLVVFSDYPVESLDPRIYDEWSSLFVVNHIFPRLVTDELRGSNKYSLGAKLNVTCIRWRKDGECERSRLIATVEPLISCSGETYSNHHLSEEFKLLLPRLDWLFSRAIDCSDSLGLPCFEFDYVADLARRLSNVYFRFGWSINVNPEHGPVGLGPFCLESSGSTWREKLTLVARDPDDQYPVQSIRFTSVINDINPDVALFWHADLSKRGLRRESSNTLVAYYLVVNGDSPGGPWLSSQQSIKDWLREARLIERDNWSGYFPNQGGVHRGDASAKGGRLVLPAFVPGCDRFAAELTKKWDKRGVVQCLNTSEMIRQVLEGTVDWDAFVTPVTPGYPGKDAISAQYFVEGKPFSWLRAGRYGTGGFELLGVGGSDIGLSKVFCLERSLPLGLSDLVVSDIKTCL